MQRGFLLWIISPVMALCLSACTSVQNYEAQLNSWIGKSERAMFLTNGLRKSSMVAQDELI